MKWSAERWLGVLAIMQSVAVGCTRTPSVTKNGEESVSTTSKGRGESDAIDTGGIEPSCGHEVQVHGSGYDAERRKCFWDAYAAGKRAGFATTLHTIEGDPITFTLHIRSPSEVDVIEDNRDHFGAQGIHRSTCTKMERRKRPDGHDGFTLTGCVGAAEKIEVP